MTAIILFSPFLFAYFLFVCLQHLQETTTWNESKCQNHPSPTENYAIGKLKIREIFIINYMITYWAQESQKYNVRFSTISLLAIIDQLNAHDNH